MGSKKKSTGDAALKWMRFQLGIAKNADKQHGELVAMCAKYIESQEFAHQVAAGIAETLVKFKTGRGITAAALAFERKTKKSFDTTNGDEEATTKDVLGDGTKVGAPKASLQGKCTVNGNSLPDAMIAELCADGITASKAVVAHRGDYQAQAEQIVTSLGR